MIILHTRLVDINRIVVTMLHPNDYLFSIIFFYNIYPIPQNLHHLLEEFSGKEILTDSSSDSSTYQVHFQTTINKRRL